MISGKENLKRTIEFNGPSRISSQLMVDFGFIYEKDETKSGYIRELLGQFPNDLLGIGNCWVSQGAPEKKDGVTRGVDEWGTLWEDDGHGPRAIGFPMEEVGYSYLETFAFPDPLRPGRFSDAEARIKQGNGRYLLPSVWFTLFERMWMMRGFNNMLMDPYTDFDNFARFRDGILDTNRAMIDQWLLRDIDGIFFSDDWGSQTALLINPDEWRRLYKPCYEAMFRRVREGGAHVWMHLCGNVTAILGDLIDLGLQVVNPVQPQAMDVAELSREFGGKVTFFGGIDVQGTMITGTPQEVKDEVHRTVDLFGRFSGGYIGGTSHTIMPETPLDNVVALLEAFLEHSREAKQ